MAMMYLPLLLLASELVFWILNMRLFDLIDDCEKVIGGMIWGEINSIHMSLGVSEPHRRKLASHHAFSRPDLVYPLLENKSFNRVNI